MFVGMMIYNGFGFLLCLTNHQDSSFAFHHDTLSFQEVTHKGSNKRDWMQRRKQRGITEYQGIL
jgi:hypothetical protein